VAGGAVLGLYAVLAVTELGLTPDDGRVGLLATGSAVGSAVAGLLVPRVQARFGPGTVATAGYGVGWLLLLAFAAAPGLATAVVALTAYSCVVTLVIVNGIVARAQVTPDDLQGRVNTTARMIAWGAQPLGAALAAALVGPLGVRGAIAVVGTGLLVSLLLALRWRLWRVIARPPTPCTKTPAS
jgi:MFS family permease